MLPNNTRIGKKSYSINDINFVLFNAGGLKSKISDLEIELASLPNLPNIILICETWFDESIVLSGNVFKNYDVLRKDRNRHGGGVMILCDIHFNAVIINEFIEDIECVVCEILFDREKYLIGCFYRPPYNDIAFMCNIINTIDNLCIKFPKHNFIFAGDFNMPQIDWLIPKPLNNDNINISFLNCMVNNGFEQIVNVATRGSNILDLVFCRNLSVLPNISLLHPLVNSDHEVVEFTLNSLNCNFNISTNYSPKLIRDFRKTNFEGLLNFLMNINWAFEFSSVKSVNERYAVLLKILNISIQLYVPLRVIKNNHKRIKFYLPKSIRQLLLKKRKLWQIMKANNTTENKTKFKICMKHCKMVLHDYNIDKIKSICKSKNVKYFYDYVNNDYVNKKIGRSKKPVQLKDNNGIVLQNDISAEMFAAYFKSVYTNDNGILPNFINQTNVCLSNITFDVFDIDKRLASLPLKYSCGPDGIPTAFLKSLHNVLAFPLCLLFQQSLNSGELPSIWKCANIIPVFKGNGTRFKVENYRPISLTSSLCKVMEGIIFDSIYIHCTENNLLTDSQHGFRKNKSTSSNLMEFMDDISKSIDMKDSVDVITVDFSKAFDVISHDKLLHKLSHYGIRGSILSWIKSFLKKIV